jgi:hypothetical protein
MITMNKAMLSKNVFLSRFILSPYDIYNLSRVWYSAWLRVMLQLRQYMLKAKAIEFFTHNILQKQRPPRQARGELDSLIITQSYPHVNP